MECAAIVELLRIIHIVPLPPSAAGENLGTLSEFQNSWIAGLNKRLFLHDLTPIELIGRILQESKPGGLLRCSDREDVQDTRKMGVHKR